MGEMLASHMGSTCLFTNYPPLKVKPIELRIFALGFPGGAVVESLPANAGDMGSSPGLGRSHMPRSNEVREPQLLSLRDWSLCSTTREGTMVRGPHTVMKSGPRSPQLQKALAQKRRPNTAKTKLKKKKEYLLFHLDLSSSSHSTRAICLINSGWKNKKEETKLCLSTE